MKDNSYEPPCFTVSAQQSLEVRNEGQAPHTLTSDVIDLDVRVDPGQTGETEPIGRIFTEPGTYDFHCTLHAGMSGELTVA